MTGTLGLLLCSFFAATMAGDMEKQINHLSHVVEKIENQVHDIQSDVKDLRRLVCPMEPPELKEHMKRAWDDITRIHGYTILYDCTSGFVFDPTDPLSAEAKDGIFPVTCENGKWTHQSTPRCVPGCRGTPPPLIHTNSPIPPLGPTVWDESRIIGSKMQYKCHDGYLLDPLYPNATLIQDEVFTVTCIEGGWFPAVVPQCLKVCEGKPPLRDDVEYVSKDHEIWGDGMVMEYKCKRAPEVRFYPFSDEMLGNPTSKISSTCMEGQWVPKQLATPCTPNLAYKRPAEQVSDFQGLDGEHPGYKAEYAVDGLMKRTGTKLYISDGDVATAVPSVWWNVDLGSPQTISGLVVYQSDDEYCIHFHNIRVYVSDTPKKSLEEGDEEHICVTYENYPRGTSCRRKKTVMKCRKPITGRYVSIVSNRRIFGCEFIPVGVPCREGLTGIMGLHMAEVEVYPEPSA